MYKVSCGPHGFRYPRAYRANLDYRNEVLAECLKDKSFAAAIREECAADLLFWLNVFGWTHDPRKIDKKQDPVLPFITWDIQDTQFREMEAVFGIKDMAIVKARYRSATWMLIALFTHRWQFGRNLSLGMVSREERLVDGSQKSLFAKVDFLIEHQPYFLINWDAYGAPGNYRDYFRKELLIQHRRTKCVMEGASTTGQMFRGDRYTAILWDEVSAGEQAAGEKALASTQFVTKCRYMVSTPQGAVGAFYRVAHNPKITRMNMHWWEHPEMVVGLVRNHPNTLDPKGYWSPAFQEECDRMGGVKELVCQELCLDFVGSGSPFFDVATIQKLIDEDARPPTMTGALIESAMNRGSHSGPRFFDNPDGALSLWLWLNKENKPPAFVSYAIGIDTSWGSGKTPSVASVVDRRTGEKVAELAIATMEPKEFAEEVLLLARFFNNAYLVIEANGPGLQMVKRLIDLGYMHMYYRRNEESLSQKEKDVPGWAATPKNQWLVYGQYKAALKDGTFINRSEKALRECFQYRFLPGNKIGNPNLPSEDNSGGATRAHGDRVTADALACKAIVDSPPESIETPDNYEVTPEHYSIMTFIGRRQWHENQRRKAEEW